MHKAGVALDDALLSAAPDEAIRHRQLVIDGIAKGATG